MTNLDQLEPNKNYTLTVSVKGSTLLRIAERGNIVSTKWDEERSEISYRISNDVVLDYIFRYHDLLNHGLSDANLTLREAVFLDVIFTINDLYNMTPNTLALDIIHRMQKCHSDNNTPIIKGIESLVIRWSYLTRVAILDAFIRYKQSWRDLKDHGPAPVRLKQYGIVR